MKVLLVEDNRADARLFAELLADIPGRRFELGTAESLARALETVGDYQVVFLDLSLPDAHGLETVTRMVQAARGVPIVVLTGNDDDQVAVDAMKAGAQDYLLKGEITPSLIARTARYAVERKHADENAQRLAIAEEATRRARLLSRVAGAISASFELAETLPAVARLLVPEIADFCVIDLVREDGAVARIAVAAADPAHQRLLDEVVHAYDPGPKHPTSPALRAIATREPVHLEDITGVPPDERARRVVAAVGARELYVTPLVARDRVVGAISYTMGASGRHFEEDRRLLADDAAERIALGIDNARLYAQAQRAIRGRDELLAVVSHDLRNPLNIVALALQMVERDVDALPSALPRAKRGAERMQRLIEDLLDVARIDAGTLRVDAKPLDLASVLDDAFEQHRELATDKRVALVRDFAHGLPEVCADRHRLGQAVANLVSNALKFTPPGGSIRLGARAGVERVTLWVADTGPGIAREHLDHIFDRFWQPEQRRDGVGLGLAIVKGIVDAHGGVVEVESTVGAGTEFRIALPTAAAPG